MVEEDSSIPAVVGQTYQELQHSDLLLSQAHLSYHPWEHQFLSSDPDTTVQVVDSVADQDTAVVSLLKGLSVDNIQGIVSRLTQAMSQQ